MLSRGLFAGALRLRSLPGRLAAVARSAAARTSNLHAVGRGLSGKPRASVAADSAALLQSSSVHLKAMAKSDAAWAIIQATGRGVNGKTKASLFGHGINDLKGLGIVDCESDPYYARWKNMLMYCYSADYHEKHPTYKGCSVCPEWLYFSVFRAWMQAHDGHWEGLVLDKDILVFGNKAYSPQTCLFVSGAVNSLLSDSGAARGEWAQGVHVNKQHGKFRAAIKIDGKLKHIGYLDSEGESEEAYLTAKSDNIHRTIALLPADPYHEPTRLALARIVRDRFSPRSKEVHLKAKASGIARAAAADKRRAARGDLPTGVCLMPGGRYHAQISIGGKNKHLGYFDTPEEAGEVYRLARLENPSRSPLATAAVAASIIA